MSTWLTSVDPVSEGETEAELQAAEEIEAVRTIAWAPLFGESTSGAALVPAEVHARRRLVRDLGRAIRALGHASVMTEAPMSTLSQARQLVTKAGSILSTEQRQARMVATVDDPFNGVRMFSPMSGEGSPFIPPMTFADVDGTSSATCIFGEAFAGPPHHLHGGVSAMLMDQALGHVVAASGRPGLTRELVVHYLRPTPSDVELLVCGRVVARGGNDVFAKAWISTAAEPDTRLVTAEGHFRILRPDQAAALVN